MKYSLDVSMAKDIYYNTTVNTDEIVSIFPYGSKTATSDAWYVLAQTMEYWKLKDYPGGPYVKYISSTSYNFIFHNSINTDVIGVIERATDTYFTVIYKSPDSSGTVNDLELSYGSNQSSAPAQYCGFTTTQEGYQFVNWSITYPDGTTGTLSPGENINFEKYKGSSDPTFKLTANFAQPKLIVIPDNISVEKGGSYTLGYTAIGLDTSKYTMNLSWKSEGSSAKVGVYTIEISVISFIDKATQKHVDNPYDTKLYDGTLTVYEGDHSTLVT